MATTTHGRDVAQLSSEEATVLPLLERTHDEDMLDRMGRAVEVAQRLAPTHPHPHPHPHGPDSALGSVAVGPLAAAVDRTRDALRNLTR